VIGVLIGTALLGGCSEKHEANDTLPSPSAAETTEALPALGPADFPVPDEARTKDAAGAEAFLRYFVDLINRQQVSLCANSPPSARNACGLPKTWTSRGMLSGSTKAVNYP